jgi:hypothetical protein
MGDATAAPTAGSVIFGLILWPLVCFAIAGGGGYMLGCNGWRRVGWVLVAALALLAAGLIVAGRGADGMQGLGYVALALFFLAPGAVGALTGLLMGLKLFAGRRAK